jgi:serine/threonine-protein kinase
MEILNNRYRAIRELGAGGFGKTYLTEDLQMPSQRCCVIKQLKPVTNDPQVYQLIQERFAREAAVLEKLGDRSPQIPRLYAYFTENGQFYLVQEWVEGITLTAKVRQCGRSSESEVREILTSLLSVLDYVHSQGIVHRDIKPDNIILRHSDGKPVLIDFGAVRETVATEINSQGNPTSSIVIGTPGFMPAEQGIGRPVYASDLYSLGLTAIYLLTGKMPQEFPTDPNTGEIIWEQPSVSSSFADVLDRAVRSHQRDRFPTAKAMLEALQSDASPLPPTMPITRPPEVFSSPQTVPISPPTVRQGNASNPLILGSLIASGLIGAAVVIAIAFRPSSPTPTQTTSISSASTSPSEQPIVTPTPTPSYSSNPVTPTQPVNSSPPSSPSPSPSPPTDELPFFMVRRLTLSDLRGKSYSELDLIRNEIFARHGRRFQRPELQAYFERQPWYTPQYSPEEFPDALLTPIQMRNAQFILEYQKRLGGG